jgi:AraC-like DNA-binding protein
MPRQLLVPVRKFLRLLDYMRRVGLDPDAMIQAIGHSPGELEAMGADQLLPGTEYSRMYRNAVEQMQTLQRPIPWAAGLGSEAFELMCHCVIGCRTLGEALDVAQRYDRLLFPMVGYRMRIVRRETCFELHYRVATETSDSVFVPDDWDRAEHSGTVAQASGLMVWYAFCGWLIGRSIDLEEVQIAASYVSDAYRDGLARVFHCTLRFEAEDNKLVAPLDYLDHRLVHTVDSLREFLDNAVYGLIELSDRPSSTTAAIRSLIKLDFTGGIPSFEQMADNLHMSESSLRRRLLKEETSYQKIKDQVRCEIALEHLRRQDTRMRSCWASQNPAPLSVPSGAGWE